MKTTDRLAIEGLLALKSRATIIVSLLLFLFAFYGYMAAYQQALIMTISDEERMIPIYGEEGYKRWIQEDPMAKYNRELFQNLKPITGPNYVMSLFGVVGPLLAAIWGALFFGNEFVWRTAKVRAAHYGWTSTIKAKIALVLFAAVVFGFAGSLIGIFGGYISWNLITRATEVAKWVGEPFISTPYWRQLFVLWLGFSVYGLLGGFLALAARSPVVGAISGFAVPYIEMYLGQLRPTWWFPHAAYTELMASSFTYLTGSAVRITSGSNFVSPYLPWAVICGWLMLICAGMLVLSRRQELA
ncbi:MAG: hypothetical protein DDT40_01593 [candidate division WS2 bacterium]|nr:hypothetical protein [Bacillota bacterium]MBT9151400.1 hypothetical protein [Candidatus Psychracetigena formicireducens]